jgi:hypothetical protein
VWCDLQSAGGGWTVSVHRPNAHSCQEILRRIEDDVNFNRQWAEYSRGFGQVGKGTSYYIGNEYLHDLTTSPNVSSYDMTILMILPNGMSQRIIYTGLRVAAETDNYRLTLGPKVFGDGRSVHASSA